MSAHARLATACRAPFRGAPARRPERAPPPGSPFGAAGTGPGRAPRPAGASSVKPLPRPADPRVGRITRRGPGCVDVVPRGGSQACVDPRSSVSSCSPWRSRRAHPSPAASPTTRGSPSTRASRSRGTVRPRRTATTTRREAPAAPRRCGARWASRVAVRRRGRRRTATAGSSVAEAAAVTTKCRSGSTRASASATPSPRPSARWAAARSGRRPRTATPTPSPGGCWRGRCSAPSSARRGTRSTDRPRVLRPGPRARALGQAHLVAEPERRHGIPAHPAANLRERRRTLVPRLHHRGHRRRPRADRARNGLSRHGRHLALTRSGFVAEKRSGLVAEAQGQVLDQPQRSEPPRAVTGPGASRLYRGTGRLRRRRRAARGRSAPARAGRRGSGSRFRRR